MPWRKFNSKCNKNLNIKPDTPNLIKKKVGNVPELIRTGNVFLNRTRLAQALTNNKWDVIKPTLIPSSESKMKY